MNKIYIFFKWKSLLQLNYSAYFNVFKIDIKLLCLAMHYIVVIQCLLVSLFLSSNNCTKRRQLRLIISFVSWLKRMFVSNSIGPNMVEASMILQFLKTCFVKKHFRQFFFLKFNLQFLVLLRKSQVRPIPTVKQAAPATFIVFIL